MTCIKFKTLMLFTIAARIRNAYIKFMKLEFMGYVIAQQTLDSTATE